MQGEKELDTSTNELLTIVSDFGKKKNYTNRQMIALMLWTVAMSIEASVQLDGEKYAGTYKDGLTKLIREIDDIIERNKE